MNTDIDANTLKESDDKVTAESKSLYFVQKLSGNKSIDEFIKETRKNPSNSDKSIRWFSFERFVNLKQIGEGGFAKVYSATWLDGGQKFIFTDPVTLTKKIRTYPSTVALKSIKGSNEISIEYLRELEIYYNLTINNASLPFYGITKDPNSSEFMMVTTLAEQGSLRSLLAEGPDFGKGTPEIYKRLAYKCMDDNPEKRPTASDLEINMKYWYDCIVGKINDDAAKRIKEDFDIADKEIPNVQSLFKGNSENSNFKYVSKQIDYSSVIKTSLYGDIDSGLMEFNLSDNFGEGNEDDGEDND
ncbi:unnamed protein product [Rhizophagus irregularis]|nr:unnamed protein product [Rhizophagus irregularis]